MSPRFRFTVPVRQGEFEGVYRRELARLLIQGVRRHERLGRGSLAYAALLDPVGGNWRRRALRQLYLSELEGWQLEGRQLLEELLEGRERTFGPVEVISLATQIWPAPDHYLALGQALLVAGRPAEAQAVYAFLLSDLHRFEYVGPSLGWRIREGLAAAWEALGKDRVARGCLLASLADPAAGAGPLVAAFFLALELGHAAEALQLARRIETRFPGRSRRLDACVESLAARVQLLRAGRWVPPLASAETFGQLVLAKGSAGRICRRLVGRVEDAA